MMAKKTTKVTPVYPEVGTFKVEKDLKKVYKKLSDAQLDEWLDIEGWTSEYHPSGHPSIDRMRKCMVILYKHFPKETKGTGKKGSIWKQFTLEDLIMIASEAGVSYEETDHEAILRMRVIMAIKAAGVSVE